MKNLIGQFKKIKDSNYIVKSEITGRPFFGEIVIVLTDGKIDRMKFNHAADICSIKENVKI
jgi:hypothetical protein